MSAVAITPPMDLAPRVHSLDPAAFTVPTARDEEWRFSPVERLKQFFVVDPAAGFVTATGSGVNIVPMSEVASSWIPIDLPSSIARANVTKAGILEIPAQAQWSEPVIVDLTSTEPQAYQHLEIVARQFSVATIVIRQTLSGNVNGSIVINVGDGANLRVITIVEGESTTALALQMPVILGRDATFIGALATLGGGAVRIQSSVKYNAPGGRAELFGVFLADADQHVEHRIFVNHDQPHCVSEALFKGALLNPGARSAWIGDVLVRKDAIGTETHQANRNLLLSEGSRADSVPNLELETGDIVRAGHASATGRFDDEQLFYLQSRGLTLDEARQLVVRGFFADVLGRIGDAHWRDELLAKISDRLGITPMEDLDE
jgi:Fe-S cluster assembly protein SufD